MKTRSLPIAATCIAGFALVAAHSALAAETCTAKSGSVVTPVVELYTSEGCNSCPPADRWLSTLKSDPAIVGLAFHVDYWDRLGWKDRFADPAYTARQSSEQKHNGARFSYTPQVVIDGADRHDWSQASVRSPAPGSNASRVALTLQREGSRVLATVTPLANAPTRLAAYWATTEQGHVSAVRAGENQGVTLKHDFVVRDYQPVAAWSAASGKAETLSFDASTPVDGAHPRSVNLVVVDAATGKPLQALKIGC